LLEVERHEDLKEMNTWGEGGAPHAKRAKYSTSFDRVVVHHPNKVAIEISTRVEGTVLSWAQLARHFVEKSLLHPPQLFHLLASLSPHKHTRYLFRYADGYASVINAEWASKSGITANNNSRETGFPLEANISLKPRDSIGEVMAAAWQRWSSAMEHKAIRGGRESFDVVKEEDGVVHVDLVVEKLVVVAEDQIAFGGGGRGGGETCGDGGFRFTTTQLPYPIDDRRTNVLYIKEHSLKDEQSERRRRQQRTSPPRKIVSLTKRPKRAIVKSRMFMASRSSIYAAVCKYDSLLDALHGADCTREDGGDGSLECSRCGDLDGRRCEAMEEERSLVMICIHFGGCSIFEREFDAILSRVPTNDGHGHLTDSPLYPTAYVEEALHRSVRHICDKECFLRAYHPIREFTFLWRDVSIDETHGNDDGGVFSSPSNGHRQVKKENLLTGWSCQILPPISNSSVVVNGGTKKRTKVEVVYVSPGGTEFNTKAKAIKYMNQTLTSTQRPTPTLSTTLIDITTAINPLFSPLGLLEELFLDNPWKLLVSTICLNVTTRAQVDVVIHRFFNKWPDAASTAREVNWEEISRVVTPLGLGTKRARGLIRFSREYLHLTNEFDPFSLTESQVRGLYNVGQYGWTAYEVFILNQLPEKVCDHALQLYVEYQLGRRTRVVPRESPRVPNSDPTIIKQQP
jgi:hypothetical protein